MNPAQHECPECGYTWLHGQHGGHSCATVMKETIAKRDARIVELHADLSGCRERAGVDADKLQSLRAELAAIKAQEPVGFADITLRSFAKYKSAMHCLPLYAAPVSEAKAQGVVMPERESFMAGVKAASDHVSKIVEDYDRQHGITDPDTGTREYPGNGEEWVGQMLELIEDFTGIVAPSSLNDTPVQHGTKAEISMAGCRCVRYGEGNPHWPCPLHSAPVQQAGDGMCNEGNPADRCICREEFGYRVCGGAPVQQPKCAVCEGSQVVATTDIDHNGDHIERACPACSDAPVQQVSVPDGMLEMEWLEHWLLLAAEPIGQECCGQAHLECCGNAIPVYRAADEIAAAMNTRREELRAMLNAAPAPGGE